MLIDALRSRKGRFLAPLLIAVGLAAFPSASVAVVVDDDPAATSYGPGNVSIAMRDSAGNLVTRAWTGSQWSPWATHPSSMTSGPSISMRPGPITDVFARGQDNAIYHRYFTPGGGWTNWGSIGGCASSAPASSWRGNGWLDVVIRGCDGVIWFSTWSAATGWLPWSQLGGATLYHPAIKSYANGTISIYVVGTDNQLYQKYYNGSSWTAWMPLGGNLTSGPTLSTQTENTIDVFAKDAYNNIIQKSWNGSSWSNWVWIQTNATSGPAAVAEGPGRVNLFVRGGGDLYINQFFSGSWHGWTSQFPFYPTSWNYGGEDHSVNTDTEARMVTEAQDVASDLGLALWNGLSPGDKTLRPELNPTYDPAIALGAADDTSGGTTTDFPPVAETAGAKVRLELQLQEKMIACNIYENGLSFVGHPYWNADYTIFGCNGQVKILHVGWDFLNAARQVVKHYNNNNAGVVARVSDKSQDLFKYQTSLEKIHQGTASDGLIYHIKICIEAIGWGYPGAQKGRSCAEVDRKLFG